MMKMLLPFSILPITWLLFLIFSISFEKRINTQNIGFSSNLTLFELNEYLEDLEHPLAMTPLFLADYSYATRFCTLNGTWFKNETTNTGWTNYSSCVNPQNMSGSGVHGLEIYERHIESIKLITQIGYSVSLITLLIAFFILTFNKRLRCPRNNLHLQLFLSFIIRSLVFHLKSTFFSYSPDTSTTSQLDLKDGQFAFIEHNNSVYCKIFTVVWQYSLLANYNWILMEGLYLHNLIFLNIFNDNSSILKYIILGWSLPIIFIVPWTIVRAFYENTLCWTTNGIQAYFWIIRGPITLSIILNFVFFVNITRVLFLKMFSPTAAQPNRGYRYSKWFKSTLVLVPLFGVHYAFLLLFNSIAYDNIIEVVWLYLDLLFTSFQGFFVALLYCFLNGEVQQEMRKLCQRWSNRDHGIQPPSHSNTYHSILAHSLTYLSRGRNSILSTTDPARKESNRNSRSPSPHLLKKDSNISAPFLQPDPNLKNHLSHLTETNHTNYKINGNEVLGSTESVL